MPIRIIKPTYKTFVLFLIINFTFFNLALYFLEDFQAIQRIPFLFIVLSFILFFLAVHKIKIQKKVGNLFLLFMYFPIISLVNFDIIRATIFFFWIIYGLLIIPWVLSGLSFVKNFRFFTIGISLVLILIILIALSGDYEMFFGQNLRKRYTAGLANPGIISKLAVTVFFMSLFMWLLKKNFLYLFFLVVGVIVIWMAGMRGDLYALIMSMFFFITSNKPRIYYFGVFISILSFIIYISFFANLDFATLDSWTSQRLTKMWNYGIFDTEFLNSIKSLLFGVGYFGTYFDSNFIYFLVTFGFIGFFLLLLFHLIIYLKFRQGLFSKDKKIQNISRWGMSLLIYFAISGIVQPIFPTFFNAYGLLLMPLMIGIYSINSEDILIFLDADDA